MEAPGQMALQRVSQHRSVSGRSEAHSNAPAIFTAREIRIRQHHMDTTELFTLAFMSLLLSMRIISFASVMGAS